MFIYLIESLVYQILFSGDGHNAKMTFLDNYVIFEFLTTFSLSAPNTNFFCTILCYLYYAQRSLTISGKFLIVSEVSRAFGRYKLIILSSSFHYFFFFLFFSKSFSMIQQIYHKDTKLIPNAEFALLCQFISIILGVCMLELRFNKTIHKS